MIELYSLGLSPPNISMGALISEIQSNPYSMFIFLVPMIALVAYVLKLKIGSFRTKVTSNPTLVQEKEKFELPRDTINLEMSFVENNDYDHFESMLEEKSKAMLNYTKLLVKIARRYRRIKYRANLTASENKKKKLNSMLKSEMEEMINLFGQMESIKMGLSAKKGEK